MVTSPCGVTGVKIAHYQYWRRELIEEPADHQLSPVAAYFNQVIARVARRAREAGYQNIVDLVSGTRTERA